VLLPRQASLGQNERHRHLQQNVTTPCNSLPEQTCDVAHVCIYLNNQAHENMENPYYTSTAHYSKYVAEYICRMVALNCPFNTACVHARQFALLPDVGTYERRLQEYLTDDKSRCLLLRSFTTSCTTMGRCILHSPASACEQGLFLWPPICGSLDVCQLSRLAFHNVDLDV
jgi:hypothetical protein